MDSTPKYRLVLQHLLQQIQGGELRAGQRLDSENELSAAFGYSRQTIRQALNGLERMGLIARVRGSGTYVTAPPPAAGTGGKTMSVLVVTTYLDDYIFPSIIKGIEGILKENGYAMRLSISYSRTWDEADALRSALQAGVDGIILEPAKSALPPVNLPLYQEIARRAIPCVCINAGIPAAHFPVVAPDDHAAGHLAASHLADHGHTRIAGIFKSDDLQGHLRYAGFCAAMRQRGIRVDESHILWYTTEDQHLFSGPYHETVLQRLAGCTAVVCYNDAIAIALMALLKRGGAAVPQDCSLISFDNSDLAPLADAALTSINHPKALLGQTAAQHLLALMRDPQADAGLLFKPVLVQRASIRTLRRQD